jgi:glutathione synthase/RimK-type ligase-like ATP-grasp enzyme
MEHHTPLSPGWAAAARDELSARRAARASRKTLERELASFSTPDDQSELEAILDRADPAAADELRHIIDHSHVA